MILSLYVHLLPCLSPCWPSHETQSRNEKEPLKMLTVENPALCLLYNWLAVTHFIAIKHSPGHFLNYAELTQLNSDEVNSRHLIILDYTVWIPNTLSLVLTPETTLQNHNTSSDFGSVKQVDNKRHLCMCVFAQLCLWPLTILKLWKRPIPAGWCDSRGNRRKGFIASGVGMTDGLLRKAGTGGPGRFTLPVVESTDEENKKKA